METWETSVHIYEVEKREDGSEKVKKRRTSLKRSRSFLISPRCRSVLRAMQTNYRQCDELEKRVEVFEDLNLQCREYVALHIDGLGP